MNLGTIYLVTNKLTGLQYVGKTTRNIGIRWGWHQAAAHRKSVATLLHRAMRADGRENFEVAVVAEGLTPDQTIAAERAWILKLGTLNPGGYNMTTGGEGEPGWRHDEETKRKIGAAHRGMKRLNKDRILAAAERRRGSRMKPSARAAISRPVIADGVEYPSVKSAAAALNVSLATIVRRIETGAPGYRALVPARQRAKRPPEDGARKRERCGLAVVIEGICYPSLAAAAEALGITRPGISYRISIARQGYAMV